MKNFFQEFIVFLVLWVAQHSIFNSFFKHDEGSSMQLVNAKEEKKSYQTNKQKREKP